MRDLRQCLQSSWLQHSFYSCLFSLQIQSGLLPCLWTQNTWCHFNSQGLPLNENGKGFNGWHMGSMNVRKKEGETERKVDSGREEGRKWMKWGKENHTNTVRRCTYFFPSFMLIFMWARRKSLRNYLSLHVDYRIQYLLANDHFVKWKRKECTVKIEHSLKLFFNQLVKIVPPLWSIQSNFWKMKDCRFWSTYTTRGITLWDFFLTFYLFIYDRIIYWINMSKQCSLRIILGGDAWVA